MKGFIRPLAVGVAAIALAAPPAQAQNGPPSPCPDEFVAMPFTVAPEENKDGDLWVCVKADPGQSGEIIEKDNPQPFPAL